MLSDPRVICYNVSTLMLTHIHYLSNFAAADYESANLKYDVKYDCDYFACLITEFLAL
jgi:hypothetical protein